MLVEDAGNASSARKKWSATLTTLSVRAQYGPIGWMIGSANQRRAMRHANLAGQSWRPGVCFSVRPLVLPIPVGNWRFAARLASATEECSRRAQADFARMTESKKTDLEISSRHD
jgi:hypothetical protein